MESASFPDTKHITRHHLELTNQFILSSRQTLVLTLDHFYTIFPPFPLQIPSSCYFSLVALTRNCHVAPCLLRVHIQVHLFSSVILLSTNLKIKIYNTIILPVVIYGWETWLLTLREESRLRVFENRILRRIFGPKRRMRSGDGSTMRNFNVSIVVLI